MPDITPNWNSILRNAMSTSGSTLETSAQGILDKVSPDELKKAGIDYTAVKQKEAIKEQLLQKMPQHELEQTDQLLLAEKIGRIMARVKEGQETQDQARQEIADLVRQAQQSQSQPANSSSVVPQMSSGAGFAPSKVDITTPGLSHTSNHKPGQ